MQLAAIVILFFPAIATAQTNPRIERWFEGAPRADLRWSTRASPPMLSRFQRLTSRFSIRVNGGEIERRRGATTLMMMVKLRDAAGKSYTTRRFVDLRQPPYTSAKHVDFTEWSVTAFLLPGDYELMFAMADLNSREHNLVKKKLHVAPLSGDPLPASWNSLPAVEFIDSVEPPDSWFVPEATGRLALPVTSKRTVRVDVMMNMALSETSRPVQRRPQQSLASLIAALKVLAQLDVRDGRLNIALLDVARRKTVFEQNSVTSLDWPRLKTAIASNNPQTIDVGALKDRDQDVQFFLNQLSGRIAPSPELRVVIILSPPMAFPQGVDRTPIEPPADGNYRVFYIRYQTFIGPPSPFSNIQPIATADRRAPAGIEGSAPSPMDLSMHPRASFPGLPDQLAQTVKPLHSRVFDVFSPNDFRNAIATILREVSEIN